MVRQAIGPVLRAYVEGGGTLVTEARLGWSSERGYASERIPGMGLWEVVGAREVAVETVQARAAQMRWVADDIPGIAPDTILAGRWYRETLEPMDASARVVARWEDGTAAAVASSRGRRRTGAPSRPGRLAGAR